MFSSFSKLKKFRHQKFFVVFRHGEVSKWRKIGKRYATTCIWTCANLYNWHKIRHILYTCKALMYCAFVKYTPALKPLHWQQSRQSKNQWKWIPLEDGQFLPCKLTSFLTSSNWAITEYFLQRTMRYISASSEQGLWPWGPSFESVSRQCFLKKKHAV